MNSEGKTETRETRLERLRREWVEYRENVLQHKSRENKERLKQEKRNLRSKACGNPDRFLHNFWLDWTPTLSMAERMRRLQEAASFKVGEVGKRRLAKLRRKFLRKQHKLLRLSNSECAVCGAPATARHHILQLQYGGPNIPLNICGICDTCHGEIHPWLKLERQEDLACA